MIIRVQLARMCLHSVYMNKKEKSPNTENSAEAFIYMVGPQGLEPRTKGL